MKNIRIQFMFLLVLLTSGVSVWAAEDIIYYHNDALGSPVAATNSTGGIIWKEHYLPYGEKVVKNSEADDDKIGYTGQAFDKKTGLNYFGARYYDPVIGRFMGIDPVGFQEDNTHSFNRYAYANNNPYKYIDPDGAYPGLLHVDGTPLDVPTGSPVIDLVGPPVQRYERSAFNKVWDNYGWQVMGALDSNSVGHAGKVGIGVGVLALGGIRKITLKGPSAINGAKVGNLSASEIKRIQNAADRIQTEIRVVGGRAAVKGGRSKNADFDFVIDASNRTRSKISNSLPGAGNLKEGIRKNQDIFRQIDNSSQPQIIFTPGG